MQREADEVRLAREETTAILREVERRCRVSESEVHSLQQQLDAANVLRRQLETERDDLIEKLQGKG